MSGMIMLIWLALWVGPHDGWISDRFFKWEFRTFYLVPGLGIALFLNGVLAKWNH